MSSKKEKDMCILLRCFIFLAQIKCPKEMPTSGSSYEVYMMYTELNAEVNLCDLAIRNGMYNVKFASITSFLLFKVISSCMDTFLKNYCNAYSL